MEIVKLNENNAKDLQGFVAFQPEKTLTFEESCFLTCVFTNPRIYNCSYVAYKDNKIVGFLLAEDIIQGVHIIFLYVCPDERKKGVASELLLEVKSYVDANDLLIYVFNNKELDGFYKKNGFVQSENLSVSCYCKALEGLQK